MGQLVLGLRPLGLINYGDPGTITDEVRSDRPLTRSCGRFASTPRRSSRGAICATSLAPSDGVNGAKVTL